MSAFLPPLDPRALNLRLLTAAVMVVALAGCSSGSDDPNPAPASTTPPPPAPTPPPPPPPPPPAPPAAAFTTLNAAGATVIEARTSQAPTNGATPSTVFEDFRLATATSITTIAWQGIYCVQSSGSTAPAPTASQFVIAIRGDTAGRPATGTPLLELTVDVSNVGQTYERDFSGLSCGAASNTTWSLYDYQVSLPSAFAISANTTYWLSVQAISPSYDVYWGWRAAGAADNNLSLMEFDGSYDTFDLDRAMALLP